MPTVLSECSSWKFMKGIKEKNKQSLTRDAFEKFAGEIPVRAIDTNAGALVADCMSIIFCAVLVIIAFGRIT